MGKIFFLSLICLFSQSSYSIDLDSIYKWDKTIKVDNGHIIENIYENSLDLFADFDGGECEVEFEEFFFEGKKVVHSTSEIEVQVSFSHYSRSRSFMCSFEHYKSRCDAYLRIKDNKLIKTNVSCL